MSSSADRVERALAGAEVDAAILSTVPSVAWASGYSPSWEMWPGYNPYVPEPALCVGWPDRPPVLLLPDYYTPYADGLPVEVDLFPTYSYTQPLDQVGEAAKAVSARLGAKVSRLGYEARTLPAATRAAVDERVTISEWIDISGQLEHARVIKLPEEIEAIRRACEIADEIQRTVKARAEPGRREIELANDAIAAAWELAGRRFAVLLQLTAGTATAAMGGWEPGERVIRDGDLICADTAPWLHGVWSDTCNGVCVGEPTERHRQIFAVVNRALQAGISAARPGVEARSVDEACRSVVRAAGFDYPHHSGHGLGYAHTEPPRITPDSTELVEAGMVLALEPGIYIPDWGGFRHEHVFAVGPDGNEVLTHFEHTL
jgi:Xaa-Pro aminopeptidase